MKIFYFILILIIFLFPLYSQEENDNLIQLAIMLDTSNSMDGLIDQAKAQLWKIVNELALGKKNGKSPLIEVALYEYGNDNLPANENYIHLVLPLTRDLDAVSDALFKLTTNGGEEYCGAVISHGTSKLKWSKSKELLKVIFIAGNEPFTQGSVNYVTACKEAISKGIIVNTIFCGDLNEGIESKWKDGALLADGAYMNINQNLIEEYVEAPQDKELLSLNDKLNTTYLSYGKRGYEKKELQQTQDSNAYSLNKESAVQRVITKSSAQYNNAAWDLVDAVKNKTINLKDLKDNELPDELKKLSLKERENYINKLISDRQLIQEKIQKLNEERNLYIQKIKKEKSSVNTLDNAIISAIKKQAQTKNFIFNIPK